MKRLCWVNKEEVVVKKEDFGFLVEFLINDALRPQFPFKVETVIQNLREDWWLKLEEYYQRHIMQHIEVAIELDKSPRARRDPLQCKELWVKFVNDFRPPRSAFTVDYHCHKCNARNVKLWRGWHGHPDDDGHELLCATCLAPDIKVDESGRAINDVSELLTDQIKGWLPAVPVGDTYWGYTSVPSQDVEWWQALPTYQKVSV